MLEFLKGNPDSPSGNLIVFCDVIGKNPINPDGKIIVSNVVVSFISASSNSYPVVIFPPDSLETREELDLLISLNDSYDVIQLPDFELPDDQKESVYLKERMEQLNQCVVEYVEFCRQYIEGFMEEGVPTRELPAPVSEKEAPTEKSALDALQAFLLQKDRRAPLEEIEGQFKDAIHFLKINYPKYDVDKFAEVAYKPGRLAKNLARLYLEKYKAVFDEQYETAARLKNRIARLEHSFFSGS